MSNVGRILGASLIIDGLAFAGLFAAAAFRFSANDVVPAFAFRWELAQAARGFFDALAGLQFLGLAVALGSSTGKTEDLVQGAIVPTIVLSAILAALSLVAGPQIDLSLSSLRSESLAFNASLASARSALDSGDVVRSREEFGVCKAISPDDARLVDVESRLAAAELKAEREAPPEPSREMPQPKDPTAAKDYYLKALSYSEKGDYFSANWYASTAARLDPSYTDARRLAATTWEKMHERGADPADKMRAAFYASKLEGYGLLRSGDPVGAYRVFKGLADEKHADDPDVRRYLAESLSETEKAAFFKDEAESALTAALIPDIFFRVPEETATESGKNKTRRLETPLRIIAAKDAAWSGSALYFREFEFLETNSVGGTRALVRSPYAKLIDGKLLLVCVERDKPSNVYRPAWSAGPVSGPASLLELPLSPESTYRALAARADPSSLSALEAFKAYREARVFGMDSGPIVDDLLSRTAIPFGLFTASALGALAGGRFRRRSGDFPKGLYALVPLMAAALVPIFLLAGRLDLLISVWSAKLVSGLRSLWIAAGIRTAVLFLAVLLVAGARDVDAPEDQ
jgi:hypothetical protein